MLVRPVLRSKLDGQRGDGQFTTGEPSLALKWGYYGFYSQNDWRATRKLTINLGLRWDLQAPGTERYNRLSQFDRYGTNLTRTPGAILYSGVGGTGRGQTEPDHNDWGPRIGIAYRLNDKTVVRSAYGITFDQITGVGTGSDGFGMTGLNAPAYIRIRPASGLQILDRPFNNAFYAGGVAIGRNPSDPRLLGSSIIGIDRESPTPYIQQWNFTIERELPGSVNLQMAYVGTKGTRLTTMQTQINNTNSIPAPALMAARGELIRTGVNPLNALVPNPFYGVIPPGNPNVSGATIVQRQLQQAYPAFGGINMFNLRTGSSNYHALQISGRRRFRSGMEVGANYVWSKNIDFSNHFTVLGGNTANGGTSTQFNLSDMSLDRSVANSDIPHRAVVNYVLPLPFGKGQRWLAGTPVLAQFLSGWSLSGISTFSAGLPLGINGGPFSRPDLISDPVLPEEYRCFGDGVTSCPLPDGSSIVVPLRRMLYFNPNAFRGRVLEVPRAAGTGTVMVEDPYYWGTAPRFDSRLRGFGILNTDVSISREFGLGETRRLAVRVDAANLFNRRDFNVGGINRITGSFNLEPARGPLGASTSSTFGTADITALGRSPRYLQVSARFSF